VLQAQLDVFRTYYNCQQWPRSTMFAVAYVIVDTTHKATALTRYDSSRRTVSDMFRPIGSTATDWL
jgi:hypothetical protein